MLATLITFGLMTSGKRAQLIAPPLISLGLLVIFGLSLLGTWLGGRVQVRRIESFLASQRPLLRWTYTPAEWQEIKEATWQEERGDWRIQLGCLTTLFSLTGLLAGAAVGAEEGIGDAIAGGATGTALGAMAGGIIGAAVAGGNYLAAWQAYRQPEPGEVALAPDEIYANGQYFKGNARSSYIRRAELIPGHLAMLRVELQVPPRPRSSSEEEWLIIVPERIVQAVEAAIPELTRAKPEFDGQTDMSRKWK